MMKEIRRELEQQKSANKPLPVDGGGEGQG